jgi:cytochrome c553
MIAATVAAVGGSGTFSSLRGSFTCLSRAGLGSASAKSSTCRNVPTYTRTEVGDKSTERAVTAVGGSALNLANVVTLCARCHQREGATFLGATYPPFSIHNGEKESESPSARINLG